MERNAHTHTVERRYCGRWVSVARGTHGACSRIAARIEAAGSRARVRGNR